MQLCSKPQGGTRNRTRDFRKKGSAFNLSSDHWTDFRVPSIDQLCLAYGHNRIHHRHGILGSIAHCHIVVQLSHVARMHMVAIADTHNTTKPIVAVPQYMSSHLVGESIALQSSMYVNVNLNNLLATSI